jgi:hypothetical protein
MLEDKTMDLADTDLRKGLAIRIINGEIAEVLQRLYLASLSEIVSLYYASFYTMDLAEYTNQEDEWAIRNTADKLDRFVEIELRRKAIEAGSKDKAMEYLIKNPAR